MNESYVIVTDSCADLPKSILKEYNLLSLPLVLHYENGETKLNDEIEHKSFFERLRAKEQVKTSAVNANRFAALFEEQCRAGKDIFYIGFSSALSATYQCAALAAEELRPKYPARKIYTVDSLCASLGQGLFTVLLAKKKNEGYSIEQLYDYAVANRLHMCHEFTVDDLFFLKRGGRISSATAILGTMLAIKPVMHVDDEGHLVKVGTARGRRASIAALFEKMKSNAIEPEKQLVYICHGDCYDDAQTLGDMIKREYPTAEVMIDYVGPVIGSHSGPGTLALFYLGKVR